MRNTGRRQFKKYSSILYFISKVFSFCGKRFNLYLFSTVRNTNGKLGIALRYVFIKNIAKKVGENVSIQPSVFIFNAHNIEIGNNVSIHPMCYIEGIGGITIGDNVSIAHASSIISSNHTWDDISIPIKYNPEKNGQIVIKEDVWIGSGVRVLAGVTIQQRSIAAAGTVVSRSFDSNVILGGVPAKVIKKINS